MNKKTLAIIGVITVLLIGIVSAGLLDYFGRISGSVDIKAPTFYFSNNTIDDMWFGDYQLFINNLPNDEEVIFEGGVIATEFVTEPLGVDEFYKSRFNITAYVKTDWNKTGETPSLKFIIYTVNNHEMTKICEVNSSIGATDKYQGYQIFCESSEIINMTIMPKFGIALEGNKGVKYSFSVGDDSRAKGASRIEVSAA